MFRRCCVPECKSLRKDVIFRQIPVNEVMKRKWLQCINSENLDSSNNRNLYVCNRHFEKRFFTEKNRLNSKAYPSLFTDLEISTGKPSVPLQIDDAAGTSSICDHNYSKRKRHFDHCYAMTTDNRDTRDEPNLIAAGREDVSTIASVDPLTQNNDEYLTASISTELGSKERKECFYICRTCLATNVKMYRFCELTTFAAYTQLTGVEDLGSYPYICYECAARLRKSEEFRFNCLKALETLSNKQIPEEIETDRELKGLQSPLHVQVVFEALECIDTEISNQIDEVETINEDYNDENYKKQEYIETHELDIRDAIAENEKRKIEQNYDKLKFPLEVYAKITIMTAEEAKREVEKRNQTKKYRESPFKCSLCYRGFFTMNLYDGHMKKHSLASGEYECEFCFLRFPKINIKRIHFAKCHKVKIFCKTCPYICFNPSLAKKHMKIHTSLNYTCDKCQNTFSEPSSFYSHECLSHPTNSVCSFCGDTFITDDGLKAHISRTHKQQILKDIETDRELKDSQSPMQVQVLDSEELEISDEVEIAVETINQYYNNENIIIQEFIEFDTHESDAVAKDSYDILSGELDAYLNTVIKEEKHDTQDVIVENEKLEFDQTKKTVQAVTLAEYLSSFKNDSLENDELNFSLNKDLEEHATVIKITPEEAKWEVDQRKESKNYKKCLYKCNLCYQGFLTKNTHANHMKKHSATSGEYQCEFCFLRFPKKSTRRKHVENCHKVKIFCKKCPRVFTRPFEAKRHMISHKGAMFKCDECSKSFRFNNSLCSHKRVSHPKNFVCAFCGDSFLNDYGLKLHIARAHKQEQNEESRLGPSCVECNVHFATETAWKRHLVLSVKHQVSNGCKICGERFADKLELRSHMLTHGDDTRLRSQRIGKACPLCNKSFSSIKMYCKHMKSEHPDSEYTRQLKMKKYTFVCEFCGKSFAGEVSLAYHINTHTKESSYKCNVCEKIFFSSGPYYTHQRNVHNSNKPFQCDLCGKAYKAKFSLKIHMKRAHLNILEHKCYICGKAFVLPCEVKYHREHVHANVPWPKRDRSKRNRHHNH